MDSTSIIAVVGDVHGHLQLACAMVARWQKELDTKFEAVFLCGDVGTFTDESQLDSATRAHVKKNPCELEFLKQWSIVPQAPWLDYIFKPEEEDGLGLTCPVVMVHGNHEGFDHLARLVPTGFPEEPVTTADLPPVDTNGHIRLLPSGWRIVMSSGSVVAGIGGIERGQRRAAYHPMAYIDEDAIEQLLDCGEVDALITHQGPSGIQGEGGSDLLQILLDEGVARTWFHGHSIRQPDSTHAGPRKRSLVVPLGDIAFHVPRKAPYQRFPYEVGKKGWAYATYSGENVSVVKETPGFFREFRRTSWTTKDELPICPPLAHIAWQRW